MMTMLVPICAKSLSGFPGTVSTDLHMVICTRSGIFFGTCTEQNPQFPHVHSLPFEYWAIEGAYFLHFGMIVMHNCLNNTQF